MMGMFRDTGVAKLPALEEYRASWSCPSGEGEGGQRNGLTDRGAVRENVIESGAKHLVFAHHREVLDHLEGVLRVRCAVASALCSCLTSSAIL
jgi:hypothetical protein